MRYIIVCMILLFVYGTVNGQTGKKIQTDLSPSGTIVADHYFISSDEPREIFLRDTAGHSASILLTTYNRNAGVLFSPDEKWLVVNDHAGSNISAIRVFRRTQGLHYKEVPDSPLDEEVWKLFHVRHVPDAELDLLHTYTVAMCWGVDSDSLLVEIRADAILLKDKSVVQFGPWRCVYSIEKSAATDDPGTLRQLESKGNCR